MKKNIYLFTILLASVFTSCGSTKSVKEVISTPENISGNWSLVSLNNEDVNTLFEEQKPSILIDQAAGTISGMSGCNSFSGQFTFNNKHFSASNLVSTLMLCNEKNAEPQFIEAISDESLVYIDNNQLVFSKNGKAVAKFKKGIDNALLSGTWTLESIDGQNANTLFPDALPTIKFLTKEHKVAGMGGCNNYNANYDLDGFLLNVGPIMTTRMACPNSSSEAKYINALKDSSVISLEGNTLTLSKDGKETLKFTVQR